MAHINLIPGDQGVRLSTLSPKYLHTNSTSHTWPFSAIAELIDNAYDPDVDASQLWIDVERYGFEQCLVFTDNGAGMDSLKLHKMLSFGFCEKVAKNDHLPVGHYGNGFKSGSMRLGKDALVFTKSSSSRSVGFLSQTYLEAVEAQTILVPIVSWDAEDNMVERADGDKALQDILTHSLFKNKNDLMQQFNKIKSSTGTRIIISNMRRTQEGKYEFDFRISPDDIRIPDDVELENNKYKRQERQNHIPESDYSLRAYCSILYLKPRMQIILRGKKVKTTVITKSLSKTEVDTYKPQGVFKPIKVTFGFSQNKNHYGIMMYHRNRLIKPYVRVGYQLKANNLGVGVIGVIQCDYLQPTHNKQDFDYTKAFRSSMSALGSKLNDYWNEKKGKTQINSNAPIPEPKEVESVPDQLWVQCDNPECLKWRKLPPSVTSESLPEKWYCSDHPEEQWRSCDVPEELEEEAEDSVQPYVKKQKKRIERELEEKKRRENEAKRIKEREFEIRSQQLKQKEKEFEKLMQSVKKKGQQQQQQQKQNEAIKKETASPQKSQGKNETVTVPLVKVAAPPPTRKPSVITTARVAPQGAQVILTPVSMNSSPLALPTGQVVSSTPIRTTLPTAAQHQTSTTSVQLVKVIGPSAQPVLNNQNKVAINLGTVTASQPGLHPKVNGPPVVIKVGSKAAVEQVNFLPTMVPVTAIIDPKVVSVQSLAGIGKQPTIPGQANVLIKTIASPTSAVSVGLPSKLTVTATPGTTLATPKASMLAPGMTIATPQVSMATPGITIATPQVSMATPVTKPGNGVATSIQVKLATGTSKYLPLESLKEVNRQATLNTMSPVTAVMDDTNFTTTKPPQQTFISPAPMERQDVTINNRYRYIAPTGQPVPQGAQTSTTNSTNAGQSSAGSAQQLLVLHQVKQEAQRGETSLADAAQEVCQQLSTTVQKQPIMETPSSLNKVSDLKRHHEPTNEGPSARKIKTEDDVIIIDDPPSPSPDNKTNGQRSDSSFDASLPNMDIGTPNKGAPNDDSSSNMAASLPSTEASIPNKGALSPNKDIAEPKVEEIANVPSMINIDKDIIEEIKLMSPQQQLQALVTRTQQLKQLYSLRENVLKLLQVLVPELEVSEFKGKYQDKTIDDLLQQVLEQAEKSDPIEIDS